MAIRILLVCFVALAAPLGGECADRAQSRGLTEDLDILQGKWVPAKSGGKGRLVLEFGFLDEKEYLFVWVWSAEKKKPLQASWGTIKLREEKSKRSFGYGGRTRINYRLEKGKLILDGVYRSDTIERDLSGEWKKWEPATWSPRP